MIKKQIHAIHASAAPPCSHHASATMQQASCADSAQHAHNAQGTGACGAATCASMWVKCGTMRANSASDAWAMRARCASDARAAASRVRSAEVTSEEEELGSRRKNASRRGRKSEEHSAARKIMCNPTLKIHISQSRKNQAKSSTEEL